MSDERICSVQECGKKHFGLGLCNKHHWRLKHYGHTNPPEKYKQRSMLGLEDLPEGEWFDKKRQLFFKRRHPLFTTWHGMHDRCINHPRYAGRGISVCERWSGDDGFINFIRDMYPRPEGKTMDRINNNGNYSPDNCRWATRIEQAANKGY